MTQMEYKFYGTTTTVVLLIVVFGIVELRGPQIDMLCQCHACKWNIILVT
jgi:hypothetical protein